MSKKNLPKVATQWNSGTTRESNTGPRVRIPSALTTKPMSHTTNSPSLPEAPTLDHVGSSVPRTLRVCPQALTVSPHHGSDVGAHTGYNERDTIFIIYSLHWEEDGLNE